MKKAIDPRFIEELKEMAGSTNVLIDAEDLYVYSFLGPLGLRRGPRPIALVRLHSEEEALKIMKLCRREGVHVVRRGEAVKDAGEPLIILDLLPPPGVEWLRESFERSRKPSVKLRGVGYTDPMSWLRRAVLSDRLLYRCRDCPRYGDTACSGYCPMAPFYGGVETWSAKGRLLLTRALVRGDLKPTRKLVDSIFTCTTCGLCYAQCVGSEFELYRALEFARQELSKEGLSPEVFRAASQIILEKGRPYLFSTPVERVGWLRDLPDVSIPREAEVLYWVGCTTSYLLTNIAKSTFTVLKNAGIDFMITGEDEGCCGLLLVHGGLWGEAEENAMKIVEKLRATGAKRLVTGCSGCYYAFNKVYPELLGVQMPMEVLHTSQILNHLMGNDSLKLGSLEMRVTWHDPCTLGRHCGVYEPPREVLRSIPGLHFSEMPLNRAYGRCCGGGGGFWGFNRDVAMKISSSYLVEDVSNLGVEAVVTACPTCYLNLSRTARRLRRRVKGFKVDVYDLAEVVGKALH
ncbi:MAG: heterodisulfide reductase-related iron-sulfur binding cluster [Candidatus Geothermarchaeales archaeon]